MPLLTFDFDSHESGLDELKGLMKTGVTYPAEVECGETNEHWIRVTRSTKELRLICKITGKVLKKHRVDAPDFDPRSFKLTPAQLGSIKAALAFKGDKS